MIDIRCTRDGFECSDCPIKPQCDKLQTKHKVNLWEIYEQGRADAIDEFYNSIIKFIDNNDCIEITSLLEIAEQLKCK